MKTEPKTDLDIIGKSAWYICNGMEFTVTIKETRRSYGRIDVLVTPVSGAGERWVSLEKIVIVEG